MVKEKAGRKDDGQPGSDKMKTIKVAAAVIRNGDKIFSAARGYGEYKGWWEFPGKVLTNNI